MKRKDYLAWDEYFMGLAIMSSMRSKDDNTQVGACIADSQNRVVSLGYNGMPNCCDDDEMPWEREGDPLSTKYMFVVHAEANAIVNKNAVSVADCRIYTTLFPCNECTKLIIQSGIKEVVYLSDKYRDTESTVASRQMLAKAGISVRQYISTNRNVNIEL